MLSKEDLEYYETLNRWEKGAFTKRHKYSRDQVKEWGRQGGQAKNPLKGYGTNRELAKEMAQRNIDNIKRRKNEYTTES